MLLLPINYDINILFRKRIQIPTNVCNSGSRLANIWYQYGPIWPVV